MRTFFIKQLSLAAIFSTSILGTHALIAQDSQKEIVEPIYRLSHNDSFNESNNETKTDATTTPERERIQPKPNSEIVKPHPLDKALTLAKDGLNSMQTDLIDYKAIMVKRERINGKLLDPVYYSVKIRNPRQINGKDVPFSIYMRFLKPAKMKGQEVIWIDGRNNNKLVAHGVGPIQGLIKVNLDPKGSMAMKDNRYPIYDVGIENLVKKLIEKGTRDRNAGPCKVRYVTDAKINKRSCTMVEVIHDVQKHPYEFHKAQIFIDDELQVPVRYASYLWPTAEGKKPPLLEEYTYVNVEKNVGLTDFDFDPSNPEYDYPN